MWIREPGFVSGHCIVKSNKGYWSRLKAIRLAKKGNHALETKNGSLDEYLLFLRALSSPPRTSWQASWNTASTVFRCSFKIVRPNNTWQLWKSSRDSRRKKLNQLDNHFFSFYDVKQEDSVGVQRFTPNTSRFLPPNLYTIAPTELSAESSCIYRGSYILCFFFFYYTRISLCVLFLSNQFPRSVS